MALLTQQVIFKADDIRQHEDGALSPGWNRFIDLIRDSGTTAALGLIGDSLENPSAAYLQILSELLGDTRFEIWNHGYDHHLNRERDDGTRYSEFHGTSEQHQRDHLTRTQQLAKDRLATTLTTFGAPGNHIDDSTLTVLDTDTDLTVWLYGNDRSKKHILKRTINVEHPVHHPDFEQFRSSYSKDIPLLTLQLHPSGWDDDRFSNFNDVLSFLVDQGCTFVNPESSSSRDAT